MAFEVKIPELGESVSEAVIGTWLAGDGARVEVDQPILELESDKANMELVAEQAGTLKLLRNEGETVSVGEIVATIEEGEAAAPSAGASDSMAHDAVTAPTSPPPAPLQEEKRAPAATAPQSPAVRRIAEEAGLDLKGVAGSGPGGRVTKGDALALAGSPSAAAEEAATPEAPRGETKPPPPAPAGSSDSTSEDPGSEQRVPMSRLRQVIAKRLVEAQHVAAILTTFNEVDLTAVQKLRSDHKAAFQEKHGISLGYMSFFVKACCAAARAVPELNAEIQDTDMVLHQRVHMGVAVGSERGLVVPVVRNADLLSFAEVEREIGRLADLARQNRLAIDDLSGATFTISNGGVYGSLLSTPILTPPQSGILGMHKIEKRPIVVDDQIEIRPMMYLALSYDHRIVDGKGAVTFLVHVKEALEDPTRLLLEL